jgi:hypothetical protein
VSSATTERNALIGDDAEKRSADVPIVQLNPAGTLNWKYKGEMAVRTSGLPYCVVRPTGLIQEGNEQPEDKEPYTLSFSQVCSYFVLLSDSDSLSTKYEHTEHLSASEYRSFLQAQWALDGQKAATAQRGFQPFVCFSRSGAA